MRVSTTNYTRLKVAGVPSANGLQVPLVLYRWITTIGAVLGRTLVGSVFGGFFAAAATTRSLDISGMMSPPYSEPLII